MNTEKKLPSSLLFSLFFFSFLLLFFFLLSSSFPSRSLPFFSSLHAHAHHICYGAKKKMLASSLYFGVQSPISVVK